MTMAMRGVVLALLVLRRVPGSHSPTLRQHPTKSTQIVHLAA